jgi:MoaA/NifB/PqqE/SkfB family radical SAM enzyme
MNNTQRLKLGALPIRRVAQGAWNTLKGESELRNTLKGESELPVRPYYASINVTYRCNLKCVHCSLWDHPKGEEEMSLDELKEVVLKLKHWLNLPAIDILGGEPFLRPEIIKLIRFATEHGMFIHIVTNGTMLTDKRARELIELDVHKIAVSLDGFHSETHDRTRGVEGAFHKTIRGVERLKHWKDELGGTTRIAIHTILNASTLDEIPQVMDWVVRMGLDGFHLIPLDQDVGGTGHGTHGYIFEESWHEKNPLWIRDIPKLEKAVTYVIEKKREGYPVADPVSYLKHTIPYFRDSDGVQSHRPCRAGSELVEITPRGGFSFCPYEPPIGNLRTHSPEKLWSSERARAARLKVNACTNKCFFPFCAWNPMERAERFWKQFVRKPRLSATNPLAPRDVTSP